MVRFLLCGLRRRVVGQAAPALFFALIACNPPVGDAGSADAGEPTIGPEGGLLDFDVADIPAPWEDAGADTSVPPDAGAADVYIPPPPTEAGGPPVEAGEGPTCTGVAYFCDDESAATCASVQGCSPTGMCTGVSEGCYSQFGDFSCISLEGCVWDTATSSCSGLSWACDLFSGQTSCGAQLGCTWSSTCDGIPTPCDLFPAATCTSQPGCFLQP
jgi:hypothetical protein